MKTLLCAAGLTIMSTAAFATCPDFSPSTETHWFTGYDLGVEAGFDVIAGGDNNLENCGPGELGWVATPSDFGFNVEEMDGLTINFGVVSECDTVLLVNDPMGEWHYNDDANVAVMTVDPMLDIIGLDGLYNVWVGTIDGSYCEAKLLVATY